MAALAALGYAFIDPEGAASAVGLFAVVAAVGVLASMAINRNP